MEKFAWPAQTDNRRMNRSNIAIALLATLGLLGCSPTFNWREIRPPATPLVALLPCKPDQAARVVPLGGKDVEMHMLGCDAGGATFAVAHADIKDAGQAGAALVQWKTAMLGNMHATSSVDVPFVPPGASALPQSERVVAQGSRPDGSKVAAQGAWFARGSQVFHAVVYADKVNPEVAETFFSGLRFQ